MLRLATICGSFAARYVVNASQARSKGWLRSLLQRAQSDAVNFMRALFGPLKFW
jgi:hypothetical protein